MEMIKQPAYTRIFKRGLRTGVLACIWSCMAASAVSAAEWPTQPLRIVAPFTAGGTADVVSRLLGEQLGTLWKQPVVVENKVGAGGAVAASQVARAKADGYTMLMISGSMFTVNPNLYKNLPYKVDDFKDVSMVTIGPMVVAVNKKMAVNSLDGLLSYSKTNNTGVNFGSAGIGSQTHMAAEMLLNATGMKMMHIPYSGENTALTDLIAGQIQMVTANLSAAMPFIKSGDVKALAVTGNRRSEALPEVPTVQELIGKDFDAQGWFAVVVPKGTPDAVVQKIAKGIETAVQNDNLKRRFSELGVSAAQQGQKYMQDRVAEESVSWKKIIQQQGIKSM